LTDEELQQYFDPDPLQTPMTNEGLQQFPGLGAQLDPDPLQATLMDEELQQFFRSEAPLTDEGLAAFRFRPKSTSHM
jgi:hypothetical protein